MRKYLYAGAVASGFLLLSASPAHADVLPGPASAQQRDDGGLGGLLGSAGGLDPAGGLNLNNPLGGSQLIDVRPGDNTPDVTGAAGNILPAEGNVPAARTGLGKPGDRSGRQNGNSAGRVRPAAGEALPVPGGGLPTGVLGGLPVGNLLGGGLPLIGGLLPDGRTPAISGMGADQESGLLDGGLPLLGGLGGLLPTSSAMRMLPAFSGMPAGGTAVPAGDQPRTKPAARPAADPAVTNDARLHEEPTDPEGKAGRRTFSGGRPVAGADPDYK